MWRSGKEAILDAKYNPDWLNGRLLILWTGSTHVSEHLMKLKRDYKLIRQAGLLAKKAVHKKDTKGLAKAVLTSYKAQLGEKMNPLPKIPKALGWKYLGSGHGGYALYIFNTKNDRNRVAETWTKNKVKIIEPYIETER